jgi:hypothetical protein
MKVVGWSPHLTQERAIEAGVQIVESKEEIFRQSDIVSIHMVLSESTQGMITASDLSLMKPTAFFINSSRGPLVDEVALIDVLQRRKIAGAGLDVYDLEPLPLDHPLRRLDNVTLSPHTGYVSDANYEVSDASCKVRAAETIHRYFGEKLWKISLHSWKENLLELLSENVHTQWCSPNVLKLVLWLSSKPCGAKNSYFWFRTTKLCQSLAHCAIFSIIEARPPHILGEQKHKPISS